MDTDTIKFIIMFLLGNCAKYAGEVHYGSTGKKGINIIPSDFFNDDTYMKAKSMPEIPLREIDGIPVLFGDNRICRYENRIDLYVDVIAATFFFVSRYEECVEKTGRDEHGRFKGKIH